MNLTRYIVDKFKNITSKFEEIISTLKPNVSQPINSSHIKVINDISVKTISSKINPKPELNQYSEDIIIYITICVIVSILITIICYMKFYKYRITTFRLVQIFIFIGWLTDFIFTWRKLYRNAQINTFVDSLALKSVEDSCFKQRFGIFSKISNFFWSNNKCKQYHHIVYNENLWSISPILVLSEQFITPAKNFGNTFGNVASGILNSMPWGLNIILLPILLIFLCIFSCIIISYSTHTNVELNFFYIMKLKFNCDEHRKPGTGSDTNKRRKKNKKYT